MLKARCDLPLADPGGRVGDILDAFREHAEVRARRASGRVRMPYGRFVVSSRGGRLSIGARAPDETGLAYVKMTVANTLPAVVGALAIRWTGDGTSGKTPPYFRPMRVERAFDVTPTMRRVILSGERLESFAGRALHVRLLFPPKGREPRWPTLDEAGREVWPEGEDALAARVYTIRDADLARGEVAIDILRHDGDATPGSAFAVGARPGDVVGMSGPLGGGAPAARRLVLFGDETAIPAIERIFRLAGPADEVRAVIEVAGLEERQDLRASEGRSIEWLHRGRGRTLADAARALTEETLGADGYVWAGCEHEDFVAIRRHCRTVLSLPRERHHVVAYWRKGARGR